MISRPNKSDEVDRAGITAFQGAQPSKPAPLLNFIVRLYHLGGRIMLFRAWILMLCGLLLLSGPAWTGDAKEQEKLQGTWSFTELSQGGDKDEEKRAALQMVLKGNTFTLAAKGKAALQGTYVVNPSQKPKTMDITFEKDGEKRTAQAIYEFEGDTLKLCHFVGDSAFKQRPKELVADKLTVLGLLKREKK